MSPLVLLHGSFGCAADWDGLGLEGATALDLPGHGAALEVEARDLDEAARYVLERTPAGATLVGYSLGGRVALHAALKAPGHLGGLVLESAHPGLEVEAARAARAALDDERAALLARDPEAFLTQFWSAPLFASFAGHPAREALLRGRVARASRDPARLARVTRALSLGRQANLWPRLAEIACPVLYVSGALDEKYSAIGRRFARHVEVKGAGHNVHLEAPEAFREALAGFAARREAA